MSDAAAIAAEGMKPHHVGEALVRLAGTMAFCAGFVHADLHPGARHPPPAPRSPWTRCKAAARVIAASLFSRGMFFRGIRCATALRVGALHRERAREAGAIAGRRGVHLRAPRRLRGRCGDAGEGDRAGRGQPQPCGAGASSHQREVAPGTNGLGVAVVTSHPERDCVRVSAQDRDWAPQLVVLDHGLYTRLSEEMRLEYCRLWCASGVPV